MRELKGFGAFKGRIQGKALNISIHSDRTNLIVNSDTILITHMTHPDDTALIQQCAGIVTDEGGILSHAAIVARELQKPCVIGTKIATRVIKDGMTIEIDGDTGIVKLL